MSRLQVASNLCPRSTAHGVAMANSTHTHDRRHSPPTNDSPHRLRRRLALGVLALVVVLVTFGSPSPAHATAGPPNDNFVNRQTIRGMTGSLVGNTNGATREPGEHFYSLWYQWTAP